MRLEQGKALKDPRKPENVNLQKPHDMMPDDRWLLYFYWLKRYIRTLNEEVHVLGEKYREILRQYEEIRNIEDCRLMKQLLVVCNMLFFLRLLYKEGQIQKLLVLLFN